MDDIGFLASDKLQGRGTGSTGERMAATYIAGRFREIGLKSLDSSYLRPFSFSRPRNPHDTTSSGPRERSQNVIGFLDNGADLTVVVGAHYDHLGLGHDHNSLDANPDGKIHHGADDNASGVAGMLDIARHYAGNGTREGCNLLFIAFSGEELGLLGSKKWCADPSMPLSGIDAMINLDMIGRLNDSTKKVVVYGVGTSAVFVPLLDSLAGGLSLKLDSSGIGPSDQTSFYLKGIPVLHFFTGQHRDYHKPSDVSEKINYAGMEQVVDLVERVVDGIMRYPRLTFLKTRNAEAGKSSFKVTMGVMPDYTFEGKGMRIDGVTDNRPAARAGILAGDVVEALGNQEVTDEKSYMKALSAFSKGDSTTVTIRRGDKQLTLPITF